jgi:hypothetical protein
MFIILLLPFLPHASLQTPSPFALSILPQGGSLTTLISFGSMPFLLYTNIDLTLNFTWLSASRIETSFSKNKLHSSSLTLFNATYSSSTYKDEMRIINDLIKSKIALHSFHCNYLIDEIPRERDSMGLGHHFTQLQYSFTHQLYEHNYIDRLTFSFILNEYNTTQREGSDWLFFGTPPLTFLNAVTTPHMKCYVKPHASNWSCDLYRIEFDNQRVQPYTRVNQVGYFQTYKYRILAPKMFLNYLSENVFGDYFNNHTCYFDDDDKCNRKIICHKEYEQYFDAMRFCFGDDKSNQKCLRLPKDKMFVHYYKELMVLVIEENNVECGTDNIWMFGKYFMPLFNSTFSYEDDSVTFYSDVNVVDALYNTSSILKRNIIHIITAIMLISTITWLCGIAYRKVM